MAMDWDKLRTFHQVAEAGSFTRAGELLHLSQSAVSRQISALEESLATPLFHRHARGLVLTGQGEMLYTTVHDVFGKLALTEARLRDSKDKPTGELTITATTGIGTIWLAPLLADFAAQYPDIELHLLVEDHELDLSMRQADVAIRLAVPKQQDLVMRQLFVVHNHVYAASSYLEEHGMPASIDDLANHRLLAYGSNDFPAAPELNWLVEVGLDKGRRAAFITVNSLLGMKQMAVTGGGIALLPDFLVEEGDELQRIELDQDPPTIETYFVYPEELRHVRRIQVFKDFLLDRIDVKLF